MPHWKLPAKEIVDSTDSVTIQAAAYVRDCSQDIPAESITGSIVRLPHEDDGKARTALRIALRAELGDIS